MLGGWSLPERWDFKVVFSPLCSHSKCRTLCYKTGDSTEAIQKVVANQSFLTDIPSSAHAGLFRRQTSLTFLFWVWIPSFLLKFSSHLQHALLLDCGCCAVCRSFHLLLLVGCCCRTRTFQPAATAVFFLQGLWCRKSSVQMVLTGEEHECVLQREIPGDALEHNVRWNALLHTAPEMRNVCFSGLLVMARV